jgi:hypothetical protein
VLTGRRIPLISASILQRVNLSLNYVHFPNRYGKWKSPMTKNLFLATCGSMSHISWDIQLLDECDGNDGIAGRRIGQARGARKRPSKGPTSTWITGFRRVVHSSWAFWNLLLISRRPHHRANQQRKRLTGILTKLYRNAKSRKNTGSPVASSYLQFTIYWL